MAPTPSVRRAQPADIHPLAELFDRYRSFYEQAPDVARARRFLEDRMAHDESVIFVASLASPHSDGRPEPSVPPLVGFCQLYPTWCSVSATSIFVLSDLYVDERARRSGAGRALMLAAQAHARAAGASRLDLQTARTNTPAQALYESLGWQRDDVYLTFSFALSSY